MKKLLLIKDDLSLINWLSYAIKKQGYGLDVSRTDLEADRSFEREKYDMGLDIGGDDYTGHHTK